MINKNHFQFDCKNFFNFWKKNRKSFSEIKLFVLARTFNIQLPESDKNQSSKSSRRWNPATRNLTAPESSDIRSTSPELVN
jgi:hypothetical protein